MMLDDELHPQLTGYRVAALMFLNFDRQVCINLVFAWAKNFVVKYYPKFSVAKIFYKNMRYLYTL